MACPPYASRLSASGSTGPESGWCPERQTGPQDFRPGPGPPQSRRLWRPTRSPSERACASSSSRRPRHLGECRLGGPPGGTLSPREARRRRRQRLGRGRPDPCRPGPRGSQWRGEARPPGSRRKGEVRQARPGRPPRGGGEPPPGAESKVGAAPATAVELVELVESESGAESSEGVGGSEPHPHNRRNRTTHQEGGEFSQRRTRRFREKIRDRPAQRAATTAMRSRRRPQTPQMGMTLARARDRKKLKVAIRHPAKFKIASRSQAAGRPTGKGLGNVKLKLVWHNHSVALQFRSSSCWPETTKEPLSSSRAYCSDWISTSCVFHNVGPLMSGRLPRDRLLIPGRLWTAPGPVEGPQRPKTAKNIPSCFFS